MTKTVQPLVKIIQAAFDIGICMASIELITQLDYGVEVDEDVKKDFEKLVKESTLKITKLTKLVHASFPEYRNFEFQIADYSLPLGEKNTNEVPTKGKSCANSKKGHSRGRRGVNRGRKAPVRGAGPKTSRPSKRKPQG